MSKRIVHQKGATLPTLKPPNWPLSQVEQLLREKILERTKMHDGKFVYQQAYRLLEVNRGKGIDLVSFKRAIRESMCLDVDDADIEALFRKYDVDGNGNIELYEFIDRVLPPDYDPAVTSWVEKSIERCDQQHRHMMQADRNAYLAGRTFDEPPSIMTRRAASDLCRDISIKLQQRLPKCIDRFRSAHQLLQGSFHTTMTKLDVRQSIRDNIGIAMTETQMHQLLSPYCKSQDDDDVVDLTAFLQGIFALDEPKADEIRDGSIFADDEQATYLWANHFGKRHIVPGKGEPQPDRYQKRVHGYVRVKNKNSNPLRLQKPPPPRRRATTKFQVPAVATMGLRRLFSSPSSAAAAGAPGFRQPKPRKMMGNESDTALVAVTTPRRPAPRVVAAPSPKAAYQPPSSSSSPLAPLSPRQPTDQQALVDSLGNMHMKVGAPSPRRPTGAIKPSPPSNQPTSSSNHIVTTADPNEYDPPRVAVSHALQFKTEAYKSEKPNWRITDSTFSCR
ncbi:Aste57867_12044 [Aphanomyces stellatus]|uniref:Aste57867_12044 protein n=1 Tax=Aphanomyces stellatus TaxID=120398 RepID=A0A485KUH7_9STRA|nr:hypothetical protein As57867_011999 [Aphanomyces stellatus]VFT88899.1 Aste57867_12044 [Aphanomyces stellatus]